MAILGLKCSGNRQNNTLSPDTKLRSQYQLQLCNSYTYGSSQLENSNANILFVASVNFIILKIPMYVSNLAFLF